MKIRYNLIIVLTIAVLTGCQQKQNPRTEKSLQKETKNLYKKYHVRKMMQYTQDLAFYNSENKGRLMQSYFFNKQGRVIKIIRYDKSGNICFTKNVDPVKAAGSQRMQVRRKINDSLTVKNYNPQGDLLNKISHTYNDNGRKKSMIRKNNKGEIVEKITYKYYENGLLKSDIYWNTDINKPEQIITYEYKYY